VIETIKNHENDKQPERMVEAPTLSILEVLRATDKCLAALPDGHYPISLRVQIKRHIKEAREKSRPQGPMLNYACSCYSPSSSVCMVHGCVG